MNLKTLINQWKQYKLPYIYQIPTEFIVTGGRTVHSQFHKLCKI